MNHVKTATDKINELAEVENNNFLSGLQDLASELHAFDELEQLYIALWDQIRKVLTKKDAQTYRAVMNCYQLMQLDLIKGVLSVCRGYLKDTDFHTRRVIESVAIIIEVMKDPKNALIWNSLASEEDRKKYIKKFPAYRLVQDNLSPYVEEIYKHLCLYVHPSFGTVAGRGSFSENSHNLNIFDVMEKEDVPNQRKHLLYLLQIHVTMLKDLAQAFVSDAEFDQVLWQTSCKQYQENQVQHFQRLLDSGMLPELNKNILDFQAEKAALDNRKDEIAE